MTMIDACTNLVEIWYTKTATSAEGAAAVENTWLARYPKPVRIVSDQGPEFGQEFTNMCNRNGITHSTSTSCNPQGNSLIESIHKTMLKFYELLLQRRIQNPSMKENKSSTRHLLPLCMLAVTHAHQVWVTTHLVLSHSIAICSWTYRSLLIFLLFATTDNSWLTSA
jgi:transposase InsO family protein